MTREFKSEFYYSYSPKLMIFLKNKGIKYIEVKHVKWYKEDQFKYMNEKDIQYNPDEIKTLYRKRWKYVANEKLSEQLSIWSNNKPN